MCTVLLPAGVNLIVVNIYPYINYQIINNKYTQYVHKFMKQKIVIFLDFVTTVVFRNVSFFLIRNLFYNLILSKYILLYIIFSFFF